MSAKALGLTGQLLEEHAFDGREPRVEQLLQFEQVQVAGQQRLPVRRRVGVVRDAFTARQCEQFAKHKPAA